MLDGCDRQPDRFPITTYQIDSLTYLITSLNYWKWLSGTFSKEKLNICFKMAQIRNLYTPTFLTDKHTSTFL